MSIAIESSELMEIFQWLNEKESWDIMNSPESIHVEEGANGTRYHPNFVECINITKEA